MKWDSMDNGYTGSKRFAKQHWDSLNDDHLEMTVRKRVLINKKLRSAYQLDDDEVESLHIDDIDDLDDY